MRLLTRFVVFVILAMLFVMVTMFFRQVSFDHGRPPSLPYKTFSITVGVLLFAALIALLFRRARSFWL